LVEANEHRSRRAEPGASCSFARGQRGFVGVGEAVDDALAVGVGLNMTGALPRKLSR
jgi:hypothetical protein